MASVTLDDVKIALYQDQDQRRAAEMLQTVMRQSPSADAWYLAAQMTKDETKAIRYLRQALLLKPDHKLARRMLEKLGGSEASLIETISTETADTVYHYSARIPLVKDLPHYLQLIIAGIAVMAAIGVILLTAQGAITQLQQQPAAVESVSAPASVTMITSQQIIDQFNREQITLYDLQIRQEDTARNLRFAITDMNGAMYGVSIWVYDSVSALIEDQTRINMQTTSANVVGAANAFLIYPKSLPGATAQQLETTFRSVAGI